MNWLERQAEELDRPPPDSKAILEKLAKQLDQIIAEGIYKNTKASLDKLDLIKTQKYTTKTLVDKISLINRSSASLVIRTS